MRYNKIGMAYLFLQQYKDAQKSFDRALKQDKDCAEAWNNVGFVEQMKRNYGKASKYYEHALALKPNAPTFHYNMGSVYFARHKYPEAAQEYRTAYLLDPDIFIRVSRMGVLAQTSSPEDRAAFSFMVARISRGRRRGPLPRICARQWKRAIAISRRSTPSQTSRPCAPISGSPS